MCENFLGIISSVHLTMGRLKSMFFVPFWSQGMQWHPRSAMAQKRDIRTSIHEMSTRFKVLHVKFYSWNFQTTQPLPPFMGIRSPDALWPQLPTLSVALGSMAECNFHKTPAFICRRPAFAFAWNVLINLAINLRALFDIVIEHFVHLIHLPMQCAVLLCLPKPERWRARSVPLRKKVSAAERVFQRLRRFTLIQWKFIFCGHVSDVFAFVF